MIRIFYRIFDDPSMTKDKGKKGRHEGEAGELYFFFLSIVFG